LTPRAPARGIAHSRRTLRVIRRDTIAPVAIEARAVSCARSARLQVAAVAIHH
jgi:hypothetical protein